MLDNVEESQPDGQHRRHAAFSPVLSGQAGQLDRLVQTVRKQARSPPLVQLFENTFTALDRVRQVCCSRCPGRSLLDDPKRTCRVTARSPARNLPPTHSTQLSAPSCQHPTHPTQCRLCLLTGFVDMHEQLAGAGAEVVACVRYVLLTDDA